MPRQLLAVYPHPSPRHDEMFEPSGAVRDHWRAVWDVLVCSKPNEMRRWTDYVRRQVRENGITYNVYADPRGADRPWELDVLPLPGNAGAADPVSLRSRKPTDTN